MEQCIWDGVCKSITEQFERCVGQSEVSHYIRNSVAHGTVGTMYVNKFYSAKGGTMYIIISATVQFMEQLERCM